MCACFLQDHGACGSDGVLISCHLALEGLLYQCMLACQLLLHARQSTNPCTELEGAIVAMGMTARVLSARRRTGPAGTTG